MRTDSLKLLLPLLLLSCGSSDKSGTQTDSGIYDNCDPAGDADADCIPNGVEGCEEELQPDSDGDGTPNWSDSDSDNDNISDQIEAGDCLNPKDSDGDGMPDYADVDSDNDGVRDGSEDRDGNGVIGTCTTTCTDTAGCDVEARETCSISLGETEGVCVSTDCSNGETNPNSTDTDNDGISDDDEGTFVCNVPSEDDPFGIKLVRYVDSAESALYPTANWRIALELNALDGAPVITNPLSVESVFTFDMTADVAQVAGFLATRGARFIKATDEALFISTQIDTIAGVAASTLRVSGANTISLDGFDTVLSTIVEVTMSAPTDVTALRAALLPKLLLRPEADVGITTAPWSGELDTQFIVTFQTTYRADVAQTLYMGAVVRKADYDNRMRPTAIFADDMANGTGSTVSGNGEAIECEQYYADRPASADIIWIIDESGSTSSDRQRIADNAAAFFLKAVDAGLDFRMGVTDMNDTGPGGQTGIFSSRDATASTGDRWLLPTEPTEFSDAIGDPSGTDAGDGGSEHGLTQGRNAMLRHLPRDSNDPAKVRDDAKLVVIYVTDEKPDEIEDAGILSEGNNQPNATQVNQIISFLAPYVAEFENEDAIAHLISEPLPFVASTCSSGGSEHAFGYYELIQTLGGQAGSICADDLGPVLDAMIDSIIGDASPISLSKVPISASISVARDGVLVFRSRNQGWDFRSSSNSIIFFNMPFDPANPSDVVVSYRRWAEQIPIE
jgi:hypothetical protein